MGVIKINGVTYGGGDNSVTLTQAQYDALVDAGTVDPHATYYIVDSGSMLSVDLIYPIGSIFMSVNNVNPGTYLTNTTWVAWGAGRVPIGVDTTDTDFDTAEETGGEKSHSLTIGEIPSHAGHNINDAGKGSYVGKYISINNTTVFSTYGTVGRGWDIVRTDEINPHTEKLGGDGAHNNLQPYITCYMWKRVS